MAGDATAAQLAAFAVLLRAKGETPEELGGLVQTMRERADRRARSPGRAVDVVGTGGDRAHTVNISTMAALVVAGSGRRVVKHGNRGRVLGLRRCRRARGTRRRDRPAGRRRRRDGRRGRHRLLLRARSSTRACATPAPTRRELGVPTVFNFLGPLTNPARVQLRPRSAAPTAGWRR